MTNKAKMKKNVKKFIISGEDPLDVLPQVVTTESVDDSTSFTRSEVGYISKQRSRSSSHGRNTVIVLIQVCTAGEKSPE